MPVDHSDDRLQDLRRYGRSASRSDGEADTSIRPPNDGRAHRAARSLAALDPIGGEAAVLARNDVEVGQLVVEIVAADHQPGAEDAFDRRGLRGNIPLGVDSDEVRRSALFNRGSVARHPGRSWRAAR